MAFLVAVMVVGWAAACFNVFRMWRGTRAIPDLAHPPSGWPYGRRFWQVICRGTPVLIVGLGGSIVADVIDTTGPHLSYTVYGLSIVVPVAAAILVGVAQRPQRLIFPALRKASGG